jgi:ribose transport system permease protein
MHARGFRVTPRWVILSAVVVLLVLSEVTHEGSFFSQATLSTLTPFVGVMLIASLGQAVVIGAGGIDLSIPATMTLSGVVLLKVARQQDDRLAIAILVVIGVCVVIGLANGLLVERLHLNPFVASLAVGQIVAGIARLVRGPVPQYTKVPALLSDGARSYWFGISVALIAACALVAVGAVTLRSTVIGRRLVASSASKPAATLIGLRSSAYRVTTFVTSAVMAGIAAILLSGQLGSPDLSLGSPYLLATVVSVVLSGAALSGGRVDLIGVALGATFITVLNQDLRVRGYSSGFAQLVQAIVLGGGMAAVYLIRQRKAIGAGLARLFGGRHRDPAAPLQAGT